MSLSSLIPSSFQKIFLFNTFQRLLSIKYRFLSIEISHLKFIFFIYISILKLISYFIFTISLFSIRDISLNFLLFFWISAFFKNNMLLSFHSRHSHLIIIFNFTLTYHKIFPNIQIFEFDYSVHQQQTCFQNDRN